MTAVYDVPSDALIRKVAEKLKEREEAKPPSWANFVKTGIHREKSPVQGDWWYTRTAAILRKVYIHGPIGVSRLRAMYGGSRDKGSKPNKAKKGSGSIVQLALLQLEKLEYVSTVKGKGRTITPKGRSLLDNTAHEILQELIKVNPTLSKYR
jgi:small subunit ribosomal protein S19e